MLQYDKIAIQSVKQNNGEYIIKDISNINIGRIFIIEHSKDTSYASCRIKLYKSGYDYYEYMTQVLKCLLGNLFRNMNVKKLNIYIEDSYSTAPFTNLGFELEGIIVGRYRDDRECVNEIIFGIDIYSFQKLSVKNLLRLKGERVELKILTPEDSKDVLEFYLRNKEYLSSFEPTRGEDFYNEQSQKRGLEEFYKQYLNGVSVNFGIYYENSLIGKIQLSNIVYGVFKSAFVGYCIDQNHQNIGFMKEALGLLCNYAFDEMQLHRIEASTLVDNEKSQRVLKACGFKEVGINPKYLFINGRWRDHISFCRISS